MSTTAKASQTKSPAATARLFGTIAIVIGLVFAVAGTATWFTVRSNLAAENITLSDDAAAFQGNRVDGPIDAWLQANVINMHALEASDGKTYAELDREDPVRATVMNGSFLRASLFTSVIAFGVAAMAIGTGLVLALLGAGLRILAGRPEPLRV
jgi:hypothetical protein